MKYKILAAAFFVVSLAGCKELSKEDEATPDGSLPYISVSAPNQNSVFTNNQQLQLLSEITDKDKIKQLDVRVVRADAGNNKSIWGYTKFPQKNPVVEDTTFAVSELEPGNYVLILNTIDGRTNVGTKEVKFIVK